MKTHCLAIALSIAILAGSFLSPASAAEAKKIVFLPGKQSHGWSAHAYAADCSLLARLLNETVPGVEATVLKNGWPKDLAPLEAADAIVIACDGNSLVGPTQNWKALEALAKKGKGIAFFHYALDPGKEPGQYIKGAIGGYYEQYWSTNPTWTAEFKSFPQHPITRGVKPFKLNDEWYYHMRFQDGMQGVTPILSAVPPDKTREGDDGPHSGNPTVRSRKGMAEDVAWAYERPDGGRGFGFTGGHTHWNYGHDQLRKLLLNAMCWIAKVEVPPEGVQTKTPAPGQMEANLAGEYPKKWTHAQTQRILDNLNKN